MPSPVSSSSAAIPIIDISSANPGAASQLLAAATHNGFIFIENNSAGIPPAEIENVFNLSREFFQSPVEVKGLCAINSRESEKNRGWVGLGTERLDPGKQKRGDLKEAFNLSQPRSDDIQPFSGAFQANRQTLTTFQQHCHALSTRILSLFAAALHIRDPDFFASRHDPSKGTTGSILRLLYYPSAERHDREVNGADTADVETNSSDADNPVAADEDVNGNIDAVPDIRAGAHSDYGSITLLFQQRGQPGLEILTKEGKWASVPVDPSASAAPSSFATKKQKRTPLPVLVNIGDLLSYWTGGLLKSTVHRVVFPRMDGGLADRYSIAYFCHPLDDAELVPVPSEIVRRHMEGNDGGHEVGGKTLTARDHLNERLAASYGTQVA